MNSFEKSPGEYLSRTEKIAKEKMFGGEEDRAAIEAKLLERLTDEPWGKEGTIEFVVEDASNPESKVTFFIEYDSVIEREKLDALLAQFDTPDTWEDMPQINDKTYRRIKSFLIKSDEEVFNLKDVLGEDWTVYTYVVSGTTDRTLWGRGVMLEKSKVVISAVDPTSANGLAVLLHEVGHVEHLNQQTVEELEFSRKARSKFQSDGRLSKEEKANIILDERNADAYCLNVLRKIPGLSEALKDLKKISYASQAWYHGSIKAEK